MNAIEDRIADTYDAAREYVAARLANEAAEPGDVSASVARVDRAWSELVAASGLMVLEDDAPLPSPGVEGAK